MLTQYILLLMALVLVPPARAAIPDCELLAAHAESRLIDGGDILRRYCIVGCAQSPDAAALAWLRANGKRELEVINLGGEGEFGLRGHVVKNIQLEIVSTTPHWIASRRNVTFAELRRHGFIFGQEFRLVKRMTELPNKNASVDVVVTNSVPLDQMTAWGPGPSTAEIARVLKDGGIWIHDGRSRRKINGFLE